MEAMQSRVPASQLQMTWLVYLPHDVARIINQYVLIEVFQSRLAFPLNENKQAQGICLLYTASMPIKYIKFLQKVMLGSL